MLAEALTSSKLAVVARSGGRRHSHCDSKWHHVLRDKRMDQTQPSAMYLLGQESVLFPIRKLHVATVFHFIGQEMKDLGSL